MRDILRKVNRIFSRNKSVAILAVVALAIGMMPQVFVALIMGPISMFVNVSNAVVPMTVLTMMQILSICFFILAVLIIALYAYKMLAHKKVAEHTTWGCGYNRGNAHVQYTGASYVSLFLSTLKPLFKRVTHIKKPKELFPKEAHYEQDIEDIEGDKADCAKTLPILIGEKKPAILAAVLIIIDSALCPLLS